MPDQAIYKFQAKRDAINALYSMINAKIEGADITHIVKQVQDVVNRSIETLNLELEKIEGYSGLGPSGQLNQIKLIRRN